MAGDSAAVLNEEEYIESCLQSLIDQSLPANEHTIFVLDGGSGCNKGDRSGDMRWTRSKPTSIDSSLTIQIDCATCTKSGIATTPGERHTRSRIQRSH